MIQKLNQEVIALKCQTQLLLERVKKLETCLTIADENSCRSVSGGTHAEHLEAKIKVLKEEREDHYKEIEELKKERETCLSNAVGANQHINELSNELQRVRKERDFFKYESDNQAAAWKEIRTFIPDINRLSLVDMVRRHIEELQKELAALKADNRYQKGYGDGFEAAVCAMNSKLKEIPWRG